MSRLSPSFTWLPLTSTSSCFKSTPKISSCQKVERKVKAAFPVFQLQEWLGGSGNRQAGILSHKRESLESPNMPLTELPAKPPKSRPRYRGTIVEDYACHFAVVSPDGCIIRKANPPPVPVRNDQTDVSNRERGIQRSREGSTGHAFTPSPLHHRPHFTAPIETTMIRLRSDKASCKWKDLEQGQDDPEFKSLTDDTWSKIAFCFLRRVF